VGALQIVNNAAEYVDFYGADTVLKYSPTLSGVKEDIILESYTGQNTFTFILNTNGLNVYHTKEDRYYLAPGKGTDPVYWLGALEIYDAALNMGTGEMTVDTLMAGQKYKSTITVDESWLTVKGRAYPVTVDPSITINTNSGTNYIEDAPIYSGKPTKNYGTNIYNCAGYISGYGEGRTVVRLSGLINSPTYISLNYADVLSATFYTSNASGSSSTVYLYPLTSNSTWEENKVTWNNVGSHSSGTALASATISGTGTGAFDITSLVRGWKQSTYNKDCGFILIGANTTSGNGALYSSEHSTTSKRPYVTVSYTYTFTLFDTETNRAVVQPRKGVRPGQTRTLSNLGLTIVDTSVAVTWQSSNTAVATVNATTGAVTGVSIGQTTITATKTSGNNASVSYTLVVSELPISGYERVYNPGLWDGTEDRYLNCYNYALNCRYHEDDFDYLQPGGYSGDQVSNSDFTADGAGIIAAVAADCEKFTEEYGKEIIFTPIGKYDVCPAGTYKICLFVDIGKGFHWLRQDSDGYWSHKLGGFPASNEDDNHEPISDPEDATITGYSTPVGYFAVTPWNLDYLGNINDTE